MRLKKTRIRQGLLATRDIQCASEFLGPAAIKTLNALGLRKSRLLRHQGACLARRMGNAGKEPRHGESRSGSFPATSLPSRSVLPLLAGVSGAAAPDVFNSSAKFVCQRPTGRAFNRCKGLTPAIDKRRTAHERLADPLILPSAFPLPPG